MSIETVSPEATYLTKSNIHHPGTATQATAAEVKGRADISAVIGVTSITGGTVKR